MMKLNVLKLWAALLSLLGQSAVPVACFRHVPSPLPPNLQWKLLDSSDEAMARALLSPLLDTSNVSLEDLLMPPDSQPCQPGIPANPNNGNYPGYCGPQPKETSITVPWPCKWSWVSCAAGRIVAIDLSCQDGPKTCRVPLLGQLPSSGPQLPELVKLDLSGQSNLAGSLDLKEWVALPKLAILNVSGCGWEGPLPDNWLAVPYLQVLDVSKNRFSGPLPAGLSQLERLQVLLLGGNSGLSGYFPNSWDQLGIQVLDVRWACRLCGSTSMFLNLNTSFITGTHVNTRCQPEDCDHGWTGLHNVFQGVMAAFASVLGLTALVLVVRRVRDYTIARARTRAMVARLASGAASMANNSTADQGGGMSRGSRRQRSHRRRPNGGLSQTMPLYTVEFNDNGVVRWRMELAGFLAGAASGCHGRSGEGGRSRWPSSADSVNGPLGHPPASLVERDGDPELGGYRSGVQGADARTRASGADVDAVELMDVAMLSTVTTAPARLPHEDSSSEEPVAQNGGPSEGAGQYTGSGVGLQLSREMEVATGGRRHRFRLPEDSEFASLPVTHAGAARATQADVTTPDDGVDAPYAAAGGDTRGQRAMVVGTTAMVAANMATVSIESQKAAAICGSRGMPPPPDAIVLMPDGVEICLARRLISYYIAPNCDASPSNATSAQTLSAMAMATPGEASGTGAGLAHVPTPQQAPLSSTPVDGATSVAGGRLQQGSCDGGGSDGGDHDWVTSLKCQ